MRYDPPVHKTQGLFPLILAAGALLVYPLIFEATYFRHLMILAFVFAIVATNWDLSLGYAGLFNFEGGCYAKMINLSAEAEPEIFATTKRFGTVLGPGYNWDHRHHFHLDARERKKTFCR